ncbi:MAG TPA: rod shape-determining protein MreD [bacterium]|jgi:rod shape-determining protein MreD|nr:rod shape-determining protein MreD [bacterium]
MSLSTRRFFLILGGLVAVLVLQGTFLYKLKLFGVRPDFILAAVGSIALLHGWPRGLLWGSVGGLLEDLMSGSLPGSHALAKSIVGFALGLLEGKVFKENIILPAIALFGAGLAEGVIFYLASGLFGEIEWAFVIVVRKVIFPTAVATALFSPAIYRICESIYKPSPYDRRQPLL